MNDKITNSFFNNDEDKKEVVSKKITLNLGLAYPELPTKYHAQAPLPRPKHVGYASLLAWLLYSNRFFLDSRWFEDHPNFWAKNALMKLTPLTRFFHLMALLRPTIQRSWLKVIWVIVRLIFVIFTIIGVVGLTAFNSENTWTNHFMIGLLTTGLIFTSINILLWALSFLFEKYLNDKWSPDSKNKRLFICIDELVKEAKKRFHCDELVIHIKVLVLDNKSIIGEKISKKTIKQQKKFEKEINGWKNVLSILVNAIVKKIPNVEITTSLIKKSIAEIE